MEIKFNINQVDEIIKKYLIPALKDYKIFTFTGPLGAGKTTLIKSFLYNCGVEQNITSPTFNYVNTYKNNKGQIFNHFDLYRIDSVDDFLATGFDEFLYRSNEYNLIEWPSVINSLLNDKSVKEKVFSIVLKYVDNDPELRIIKIN